VNPSAVRLGGAFVKLEGADALGRRFLSLVDGLYTDEVNRVFGAAARLVASTAKRLAPQSQAFTQVYFNRNRAYYSVGRTTQPGRLRKAIISKSYNRASVMRYGPGAFAQVNLKVGRGNRAPYGHIVESGRKASRAKSKKGFAFWASKGFVRPKNVAAFTGRFFFKRAVDQTSSTVIDRASTAVQREIAKRYSQ
jgi:hypothetical protein